MYLFRFILLGFLSLVTLNIQSLTGQSRHPLTDSLLEVVANTQEDSIRAKILMQLIWNNITYDPKWALSKTEDLRIMGITNGDTYIIAKSDHYAGIIHRFLGHYDFAITDLQKSLHYFDSIGARHIVENILYHLGVAYSLKGDYRQAMTIYYDQLEIAQRSQDSTAMGLSYNSIGILHKNLQQYTLAKEMYHKSIDMLKSINNQGDLSMTYSNLAAVQLLSSNIDSALKYNRLAIQIEKGINRQSGLAWSYVQRADIYGDMGQSDSTLFYLKRAMSINKTIGNREGIMQSSVSLGRHYNRTGKFGKALDILKEAQSIGYNSSQWSIRRDLLYEMQKSFEGLELYKRAYYYKNQWLAIRDSIGNIENSRMLNELNIKYQTALKDKALIESKISLDKKTNQRNVLSLFVLLSLISIVFLWYRQKLTRLLSSKTEELQRQRILELEQTQKLTNISSMIEGQEAERRRIAKDLHDGLGGLLVNVKTQLVQIQNQIDHLENQNIYRQANAMIDKACDEVRRISHNMIPGILRVEGLEGAVEELIAQLETIHHIKVESTIEIDRSKLTEASSHMIYRILQEAFNNIIRHSQASQVIFQMLDYDEYLYLLIEDNGIGFESDQPMDGLGLMSIRSRVDFLNGDIDIATTTSGISISINIPFTQSDNS